MTTFSTEEVAETCGLTFRQVDHWVRRGFLPFTPSVTHMPTTSQKRPAGRGARVWSEEQVEFMKRFAALVRAGVKPEAVAEAMADLDYDVTEFNLSKEVRVAVEI